MMRDILRQTAHRPWPLPTGPWMMAQSWHDLLFAHWPIPVATMRALVPAQLELDTFDGVAWVGVVPFRMSGVRPRPFPGVPWLSAFPELNVRTYVKPRNRAQPKPGVYFFSLEAANPVAVALARGLFKLPYFNANMHLVDDGSIIHYQSQRTHRNAPPAEFTGQYKPTSRSLLRAAGHPGTLVNRTLQPLHRDFQGRAYIGEIHHQPWPLQHAEAELQVNTMAAASKISLPNTPPLLHFVRRLDVAVWLLRRVEPAL